MELSFISSPSLLPGYKPSVGITEKGNETIAVIGILFKFPGGAETSDDFWKMLMDRRCAASKYPTDRFNIDAFRHADKKKQNIVRGNNINI